MNRKLFTLFFSIAGLFIFSSAAIAQRNVEPAVARDPVLENDAKHNLDVAKQYFRLKKAYKAVIMRFEQTFAAHPDFSKMDEFLYIAAVSSLRLSENKGKQKIDSKIEGDIARYAPERLRSEAEAYFAMIVDKYPDSKFRGDAEEELKQLKAAK